MAIFQFFLPPGKLIEVIFFSCPPENFLWYLSTTYQNFIEIWKTFTKYYCIRKNFLALKAREAAKWPRTFYMVLTVHFCSCQMLYILSAGAWLLPWFLLNNYNLWRYAVQHYIVLPPRQIKSTVRLCQRIKNRRRQIQTFDQSNN